MSDVACLRPILAGTMLVLAAPAAAVHAQEHPGRPVYEKWCAECHGAEGLGDGPAAAHMLPRPRDFTQARYQIRTTASGALPTDADMMRVIEQGMPGTAMPGWPQLTDRERTDVIGYLKTFSAFFESEGTPEPLEVSGAPRASDEAIEEGRLLYDRLECWKCHGQAGRGDGTSAPTQTDADDRPIRPADLTQNWRFNGGGDVDDIYMRLRSGLDGTPMPSSSDLLEANVITEDQLWNVAHYVRSLSPPAAPEAREVVRAVLLDGPLPAAPDDGAWTDVPASYVPLVGQIIEPPRWFVPTVTAVWVQAVHDGESVVLRLVWNDPSESPDPAWDEWRQRIADVMEPKEEPPATGALPDALAVQFASGPASGRDLPYFLMGDARVPVHLWQWRSDRPGAVTEATARGLDLIESLTAGADATAGTAAYADGQWQLVLRRALTPADSTRPAFRVGEPIPIAFYAWDGSNGEAGRRVAIGSWYFLFLERPVTTAVYVVPIATILITALLGLAAVRYAQRTAPAREAAPSAGAAMAEP
ncbi:MAG: c-type cytochrome [Gemmatimonadota bacterium]